MFKSTLRYCFLPISWKMSNYFKNLDPIAKKRYFEKLHLLDLGESDDPYAERNHEKIEDDMTRWPAVEYGHIFCYFIECPGPHTRRQLMPWKSLEAYNYFQSGHVKPVRIWCLQHVSILKELVNPSQSDLTRPTMPGWLHVQMERS